MLSLWSSQKISITSRESTPNAAKMRPISLANEILVAWKALQAYLSASAVATSTWWTPGRGRRRVRARASCVRVVLGADHDEGRGEEVR